MVLVLYVALTWKWQAVEGIIFTVASQAGRRSSLPGPRREDTNAWGSGDEIGTQGPKLLQIFAPDIKTSPTCPSLVKLCWTVFL